MTRYLTIRIPVIDTNQPLEMRKKKILEELDEMLAEVSAKEINNQNALAEMFDVVQTMAGYMLQFTKEHIMIGEGAHDYVEDVFSIANDRHEVKLENYAAQRGWAVIAGGRG